VLKGLAKVIARPLMIVFERSRLSVDVPETEIKKKSLLSSRRRMWRTKGWLASP